MTTSPYSVRVLDRERRVIAVLSVLDEPRYSRRPRTATEIIISIPRVKHDPAQEFSVATGSDEQLITGSGANVMLGQVITRSKLGAIKRGHYLEVWRDDEVEITGRIELRDVHPDVIEVTAYTEEILLKDLLSPEQYGINYDNLDCADVIRDALDGWETRRLKSKADWDRRVTGSNVQAWDAAGGSLWLARDSEGAYHRNGHAVYEFNSADFPGFQRWDRIRWASDYDDNSLVYTTIQYRFGTSGPWLPDTTWPSYEPDEDEEEEEEEEEELTQMLTGERGVLPDQLGLAITGTDPILQVRVNLYTDDPDSQDEDEEGTMGSSPVFFALEVIARTNGPVTAGDIPAETGVTARGINASNSEQFEIIRQAAEQADLDFEVRGGLINVGEAFGPDISGEVNLVTS